jgi:Zn-finger nucleic acid-binding protein
MTVYCGACLSMNKAGAVYCSDCGKRLVAPVEAPEATDQECPRCRALLRRRALGGFRPLECPICCGLFVAVSDLEALITAQRERGEEAGSTPGRHPERASLAPEDVAYLRCPECATVMNRVNYGRISGVIIDTCKAHGHWLDPGELEKIARWVATGGLEKLHHRALDEIRAERERLSAAQIAPSGGSVTPVAMRGDDDFLAEGLLWAGWRVIRVLASLFR